MIKNAPAQIWQKISSSARSGVFIIAEAGKNFITTEEEKPVSEYLENAKRLVDAAALAGADAIKFQTHNFEDEQLDIPVVSPHFKGAERYQWVKRNTEATPVQDFWKPLKAYCEEKLIVFMSTPMSRGAAKRLMQTGVQVWKIGSADILDFVMLDYLRTSGLPIIMSSGMSTLEEVEQGLKFLLAKNSRVALVHALSKYPGQPSEANLATIDCYREKFPGLPIGFSENSVGILPALIAVARGAAIIEKHFTLNRGDWGSDHKVSSTPEEFKELVLNIRRIENDPGAREEFVNHSDTEVILGKKEKFLRSDELAFRPIFRKALVAGEDLASGVTLKPEAIFAMRPEAHIKGLPSHRYPEVIGRKLKRGLKKYQPITEDVIT